MIEQQTTDKSHRLLALLRAFSQRLGGPKLETRPISRCQPYLTSVLFLFLGLGALSVDRLFDGTTHSSFPMIIPFRSLSPSSPPPPTAQILRPLSPPLLDWITPQSAMEPPVASAFTFARAPNSPTRPSTACRHSGHSTACADRQDAPLQYVCPQGCNLH